MRKYQISLSSNKRFQRSSKPTESTNPCVICQGTTVKAVVAESRKEAYNLLKTFKEWKST